MSTNGSCASGPASVQQLRRRRGSGFALGAAAVAAVLGCGSSDGTTAKYGSGGLAATGGALLAGGGTTSLGSGGGVGGRSSAGGIVGQAGSSGSGGATASGGTTGGSSGQGGATAAGGATGGVSGRGGATASGGAGQGGSRAGSTVACPSSSACIDFATVQQEIDGFGAASVGHGALTATELDAAFKNDTTTQLGLSIIRVEVRVEGPSSWATEKANAAGAKARGAKYAMASPWTPPASMKSNNNTVGGSLSASAYADYAAYLKSFADAMGTDVDIISMQNEPNITVTYVSCNWNPTQMFNFVKTNAQDIGKPVLMPETSNYDKSYSDPVLNDATAAAHITHVGLHLYGAGPTAYTLAVQKQKRVWMTEHMYDPEDIGTMMTMAKEIMDCMNSQMNAYVWWYLRVPNCNLITSSGTLTNKGAIMGQFSKFVRPGAQRATAPYQPQSNVYVQAYAGTKNVIIALNRNTAAKSQDFTVASGSFANVHKYTTSNSKKLADDGPVTVNNGTFTASLEPQSVTTFVADATP
jgi:glucuronoarabinoxylan endo-1,4-beta-xylanase